MIKEAFISRPTRMQLIERLGKYMVMKTNFSNFDTDEGFLFYNPVLNKFLLMDIKEDPMYNLEIITEFPSSGVSADDVMSIKEIEDFDDTIPQKIMDYAKNIGYLWDSQGNYDYNKSQKKTCQYCKHYSLLDLICKNKKNKDDPRKQLNDTCFYFED